MSTTNYPLGSKLNPISAEIYHQDLNSHNWLGGWVGSGDDAAYYDRQGEQRNCTGSYSAPYDADVYDELTENAMWIGGWVLEEDEDGEPFDFPTYITAESTTYPGEDEEGNVFGNEDYPIPIAVYEEMCELDIWTGGWVIYPNGTTEEFPENEGGASGSGSGSGCGCGCGNNDAGCGCGGGEDEGGSGCGSGDGYVVAGIDDVLYLENKKIRIVLSWNSGYSQYTHISLPLTEPPYSYLTVHAVAKSPYSIEGGTSLTATWTGLYEVTITGNVAFKRYKSDTIHYKSISREYNIPNGYIQPVPEL